MMITPKPAVPGAHGGEAPPEPYWESVLSPAKRRELNVLSVIWFAALVYLWTWWLQPAHLLGVTGFLASTFILAWTTIIPFYFIFFALRAKRLKGPLKLPAGARVAMVVTKAPSEPADVVMRTLEGMLAQDVEHDTWLADEAPTPAMLEWCEQHGVRISTRFGRADYHRKAWPRRTRCKEGNLAFFYDQFGYDGYDFVAQLDADHVPEPGYLREMLRPFADPAIGYVSAPSICDANASESWAARGRLIMEAPLHGIMQAGYSDGWAPLCIGSHYAVRTAALKDIGGLGPELAEDHSTTLMMNAHGWRGVHALDAIAHGDGPRTFADLAAQEFQWSRSLMTILLTYTPLYLGRLPARLRLQFLFSQLWYPLFAFAMAMMFATPIAALATANNLIDVSYPEFLLHVVPASAIIILMWFRWRSSGAYRPGDTNVLSWEALLFVLARWPWALAGSIMAICDWFRASFVDFRVTPKGSDAVGPLPARIVMPYAVISFLSLLPVLLVSRAGAARGFYIFALVNGLLYAALLLVIIVKHLRENAIGFRPRLSIYAPMTAAFLLVGLTGVATTHRGAAGLQGLSWNESGLMLFDEIHGIAGAGQGGMEVKELRFAPHWISDTEGQE